MRSAILALSMLAVAGPAGGEWDLVRRQQRWELCEADQGEAAATVEIDQDTAWRLFTRGMEPETARRRVQFAGDRALCEPFLATVSILA